MRRLFLQTECRNFYHKEKAVKIAFQASAYIQERLNVVIVVHGMVLKHGIQLISIEAESGSVIASLKNTAPLHI